MNLKDITLFFRNRRNSVFLDLACKYLETVPKEKAQALLTLLLSVYAAINRAMPPETDLEELELVLAKNLPEQDPAELLRNAKRAAGNSDALSAVRTLSTLPLGERLPLASALLELDKTVTPLTEKKRKSFTEFAEAMGIDSPLIQDLLAKETARRATAAKVLNSGAGLAVALVVILVFILAATFLKSLIFGIILAYFLLPLEKYFEKHFFNTKIVIAVSKFLSLFCRPFRKISAFFSPEKEQSEQEQILAARRLLVMKSSVAALVTVAAGALLALLLIVSILIPAAINMGRSVNQWANSSPVLGHLEKTIAAWISHEEQAAIPRPPEGKETPALTEQAEQNEMKKTETAGPVENAEQNGMEQTETAGPVENAEQNRQENAEPEIRSVKEFLEWLRPELRAYIQENSKDIAGILFSRSRGILATLAAIVTSLGTFVFDALLCIFFFLYFIQKMALFSNSVRATAKADGESVGDWCVKSVFDSKWLPKTSRESRREAAEIINRICHMFDAWIRGYISIILIETVLYITAFSIFSVPYALPLGIIAGLTILLPFIGPVASFALTALICLAFGDAHLATTLIGVILTYSIINGILEQLILYPSLVGGAIGLTTVETIIVVLLGGLFAGITGMIFAVPAAAVIKYLIPKIYNVWTPEKQ